ncbi:sugar transferase [Patescibacteria group bacterium]|nr:sugar transferase [Patescibacteria group bacterium]
MNGIHIKFNSKEIFDQLFAIFLFLPICAVMLIVSIAIKLSDFGPVLFKQRRIGKDNKEFIIYKFRTMKVNTPNVAKSDLKNSDRYITSAGKILRRFSLDELPQIFNIVKGEVSFVGPRPALYNQYDLIEKRTKVNVHKFKPGLTGWAQVNGREELDIDTKVKYDEYYINNWSLLFDFKIIIFTIMEVFRGRGAR